MPMNTSGCHVEQALAQVAAQPQQARQVAQHFGQAHHRQFARVVPGVEAGVAHRVAADAGEFGVGEALAQFVDQAGAEQVAGGFAGDQGDARAARADAHWRQRSDRLA